jgi:hypothetical protein
MNETERLKDFITTAKARGVSDEFVVSLLRQNGWSERRIYQAFSTYYEGILGAPLPSRGGAIEYAGDAFLYLLAFISLSSWTYALGHLFFVFIDRWYPSGLDSSYALVSFRQSVTYELATIIVAFPIFLFVSRAISSGLARHAERAESGVRKWLIYIALVIASVTLVGDAIWFLNSFLQGDLTTRFVLKSLVLSLIAGSIFGYYMSAVRGPAVSRPREIAFAGLALAGVVLALVVGFSDVGNPAHMRALGNDQRRVRSLADIADSIHENHSGASGAPNSLVDIGRLNSRLETTDPATGSTYDYVKLKNAAYELCATFETEDRGKGSGAFAHGEGRTCFKLNANHSYAIPYNYYNYWGP